MKILTRVLVILTLCGLLAGSAAAFSDVPEGQWFYGAVERMRQEGLVNGF